MIYPQSTIRVLVCVVASLALSGCSTQEEPKVVAVAMEEESVDTLAPDLAVEQVQPEQQVDEASTVDAPADELNIPSENEVTQATGSFEPPFPDRIELFLAPKRQGRGVKKTVDGVENSVELLGFVNVNGQRVVLSIDGLVSPIAVGGIEAGIEVISIQPPSVVLQRGRQRWQVNLGY